jgi:hypothetical protein
MMVVAQRWQKYISTKHINGLWDYSSMKTERPIAELIRGSEYMVSAV